jgi:hypothetical protein
VNSASYCVILLKFQDAIRRKRTDQQARGVLLHHDNARPRTARATKEGIQELQWELLEHPPYSPVLAPSGFHLFGPLKNHLGAKFLWWRGWNGGAEVAVTTVKRLHCWGFRRTGRNGTSVSVLVEDMPRIFSFMFRISHVLRSISVCDLFTDSPSFIGLKPVKVKVCRMHFVGRIVRNKMLCPEIRSQWGRVYELCAALVNDNSLSTYSLAYELFEGIFCKS